MVHTIVYNLTNTLYDLRSKQYHFPTELVHGERSTHKDAAKSQLSPSSVQGYKVDWSFQYVALCLHQLVVLPLRPSTKLEDSHQCHDL